MDQAAVQPSVAILVRVDVDEAERSGGCLEHGIDRARAHSVVGGEQAVQQAWHVVRPRPDEFRQGIAVLVALAQEDAVRAPARPAEARGLYPTTFPPDQLLTQSGKASMRER